MVIDYMIKARKKFLGFGLIVCCLVVCVVLIRVEIFHGRNDQEKNTIQKPCFWQEQQRLDEISLSIHDDIQNKAVRSFLLKNESVVEDFDFIKAFYGRRIALMGDSTLFYFCKWLYTILKADINIQDRTLNEAKNAIRVRAPLVGVELKSSSTPKTLDLTSSSGTFLQWQGMAGPSGGDTEKNLRKMYKKASEMRPDVMVVNMGLHWFHACGEGCPNHLCPSDAIVIQRWLHYEEWLDEIVLFAHSTNTTRLLLFKTTNKVCNIHGNMPMKRFAAKVALNDEELIQNCTDKLIKRFDGVTSHHNLTTKQLKDYCSNAPLHEHGSSQFNKRLYEYVKKLPKLEGLKVGIFNDHDLENCDFGTEAIHHQEVMPARIRLLAETILSYERCSPIYLPQYSRGTTQRKKQKLSASNPYCMKFPSMCQ